MKNTELFGERHEQEENGLYGRKHAELCFLQNVSGSASDFYTDLMKLINAHCKKGLSKPDLVAKMEYATDSCKMS